MTVWHLSFLSSLSFTRYFAFSSLQVTFRICSDCHPEVFPIFVHSSHASQQSKPSRMSKRMCGQKNKIQFTRQHRRFLQFCRL